MDNTGPISVGPSLTAFPFKHITPHPSEILHMPVERAQALATLPRNKLSEFCWAAIAGLVGALPSAVEALFSAFGGDAPGGLTAFQTVQVAIAVVFLTLTIAALVQQGKTQMTAMDYLNKLRSAGGDES